ncbi:MAG: TetR/AcrR family transcriptional regulator [Myxococcaceae bacterium]|nr:TetR/AcrR family transcriptional regulator [Myxococcaceae bacterium]
MARLTNTQKRRGTRGYESALRTEQMQRVRERLLDAAVRLLSEGPSEDLSLRAVAERAQVSVPTAYRYFPSMEPLVDALFEHINARLGFIKFPENFDEALALVPVLYRGFEANDALVRAYVRTPVGQKVRRRHQTERYALMRRCIDLSYPQLAEEARQRLSALMQSMMSGQTWLVFSESWGLDASGAAATALFALRAFRDALAKNTHALDPTPFHRGDA